jgi:hypothetical protein
MLIGLASIILAIVFAFRAYYKAEELKVAQDAAENIRIAGIVVATALALTILGVVITLFMYGSMAMNSPKNVIGSSILFMGLALIIGILMIVAVVYAWIAYTKSMNTPIAGDVLISAIAISVAIISPFFSRGGVTSIPVLGDNVILVGNNTIKEQPSDTIANVFMSKFPKSN